MTAAICPNVHPHGAVYRVQQTESGHIMCPWCDWRILMVPVPGQFVAFPSGIDPWQRSEDFLIERQARKERDEETRQHANQKLKQRNATIRQFLHAFP